MLFVALFATLLALAAMVAPGVPGNRDALIVVLTVLALALWFGTALRAILRLIGRLFGRAAPDLAPSRPRIVVDGSNVMFWHRETPTLDALTAVLDALIARGFAPIVYFDANVGYQLFDRYRGPHAMAQSLPEGVAEVVIADSGAPADPILIARALDDRLRIVTNDRFRDWRGQFPGLAKKGVLVHGSMSDKGVTLRL